MSLLTAANEKTVYAGMAIMNPSAKAQIRQYSLSVTALFKLMIQEKKQEFIERVKTVRFFFFLSIYPFCRTLSTNCLCTRLESSFSADHRPVSRFCYFRTTF